jgi:hypothetical protein
MNQQALRAPRPRRSVRSGLVASAVLWWIAAPALALPPATFAPGEQEQARQSFALFADDWMAKVQRLEEHDRQNPTIRPGASDPLVTYRGYGDEFSIELRPTGLPKAPFVGLLRYMELLYSCTDARAGDCRIASSMPVTEIFRFQDGRWIY